MWGWYCAYAHKFHIIMDGFRRLAVSWWRHQMETFSNSMALCEGNPSFTGGFPSQKPMTRSFDGFFDLHLNKRLSNQSKRRQFETPSASFMTSSWLRLLVAKSNGSPMCFEQIWFERVCMFRNMIHVLPQSQMSRYSGCWWLGTYWVGTNRHEYLGWWEHIWSVPNLIYGLFSKMPGVRTAIDLLLIVRLKRAHLLLLLVSLST